MTNKITIDNINGVPHTVIANTPYENYLNFSWRRNHIGLGYVGMIVDVEMEYYHGDINDMRLSNIELNVMAIALPPLPRNPTADDAKLLHAYSMHGLNVCADLLTSFGNGQYNTQQVDCLGVLAALNYTMVSLTITHVITKAGEKVGIAIINREKGE